MHPLSTYEAHRRDQVDLLRRSTTTVVREPAPRPRGDAHGRPPDRPVRRHATRTVTVGQPWAPTA